MIIGWIVHHIYAQDKIVCSVVFVYVIFGFVKQNCLINECHMLFMNHLLRKYNRLF